MLVYRICTQKEVDYILDNKDFNGVGSPSTAFGNNTHQYEEGYNYLHFFARKSSILLHWRNTTGYYLCTYDIPESILNEHFGTGSYPIHFIYGMGIYTDLKEYAIPTFEMDFNFLRKIEILNQELEPLNLLPFNSRTTTIYEAQSSFMRCRKI